MTTPAEFTAPDAPTIAPAEAPVPAAAEAPLLAAAHGRPGPTTPVWFMRQAGRSLPEYREARVGTTMLEACFRPDLVSEITLQPVRRYGVDAAIFYSDIVVPLKAAGVDVEIVPNKGPVIANPVRTLADVEALPELDPAALAPIAAGVARTVAELDARHGGTPLIGFAGAPFTLASYLIEGGPSKNHERTKSMLIEAPEVFERLLATLAGYSAAFLEAQIGAGARMVQLFDSWAGYLSRRDYEAAVLPHSRAIFDRLAPLGVPSIHFGVQTGELLASMATAGSTVLGVDYRVALADAARRAPGMPLQGNLDPAYLFASPAALLGEVDRILDEGAALPGHIVNLGHGVLPTVDPDQLARVVDRVHAFRR